MKKLILGTAASFCLVAGAFAQGQIFPDNLNNSSTDPAATSGGLVFQQVQGSAAYLNPAGQDFNIQFWGGTTSGNLSVVGTWLISDGTAAADSAAGDGLILNNSGNPLNIGTGTSVKSGFMQIFAWTGNYTDWASASAAAAQGLCFAGSTAQFATSLAAVGDNPIELDAMPALVMVQGNPSSVPEPGTFALAGLGAAAMLIFRRRK